MTAQRLSFKNGIQFAWDSTSLTTFKECPRKYFYSIVCGYAPREQSVHLTYGIYLHQAVERYHRAKTEGATHEGALRRTLRAMLLQTFGWNSDDKYKNRYNLIRGMVWYLDAKKDDPAETVVLSNGKPAVELSFRFQLPEAPDFLYCGHMDRIASYAGELYVFDLKSTKRALYSEFFDQYNPHNQMTGYTLGAKVTFKQPVKGVVIDAVQLGVGNLQSPNVGFARFGRGFSLRHPDQLDEWLTTTTYFVKMAARYAEEDFWPMNEAACNNFFGCQFRPVCAKSPRQRKTWLEADYVKREWDPLRIRGDI